MLLLHYSRQEKFDRRNGVQYHLKTLLVDKQGSTKSQTVNLVVSSREIQRRYATELSCYDFKSYGVEK